jgi:hypothetical protein
MSAVVELRKPFKSQTISLRLHPDGFYNTSWSCNRGAIHSTVFRHGCEIYNCHESVKHRNCEIIVAIGPWKPLASLLQTSTPYNSSKDATSTSGAFGIAVSEVKHYSLIQFYAVNRPAIEGFARGC